MKDNLPELSQLQKMQEEMAERHMDSATREYMLEMAKACLQIGAVEAHQGADINLGDHLPMDLPPQIMSIMEKTFHKRVENLVVVIDTNSIPPEVAKHVQAMMNMCSKAIHDLLNGMADKDPDQFKVGANFGDN